MYISCTIFTFEVILQPKPRKLGLKFDYSCQKFLQPKATQDTILDIHNRKSLNKV